MYLRPLPPARTTQLILIFRPTMGIDRNQRVKDARGEASKEIEELRAKKDAEFAAFQAQVHRTLSSYSNLAFSIDEIEMLINVGPRNVTALGR